MRHFKNLNTIWTNEVFLQTIYLRINRDSESKNGVQVSKNTKHFRIALVMPPMQMDINYPLNIGK